MKRSSNYIVYKEEMFVLQNQGRGFRPNYLAETSVESQAVSEVAAFNVVSFYCF